jgi:hypothetical protein
MSINILPGPPEISGRNNALFLNLRVPFFQHLTDEAL